MNRREMMRGRAIACEQLAAATHMIATENLDGAAELVDRVSVMLRDQINHRMVMTAFRGPHVLTQRRIKC